jgi:hypothetical protein
MKLFKSSKILKERFTYQMLDSRGKKLGYILTSLMINTKNKPATSAPKPYFEFL